MRVLALACLIFAAVPSPQDPAAEVRPSGIAARINGEIITWDDVDNELKTVDPAQRTPKLRRDMLKTLAVRTLFLQEAKNYGIEVTESQVDSSLETERKRAKMDPEEFQKEINRRGVSITEYRSNIRKDLMIGMLMSRLSTEPLRNPSAKLPLLVEFVSPEEMRDYYEKHRKQFEPIKQVDIVFIAFQFQTPEERDAKLRLAESIRRRVREDTPLYVLSLAHMDKSLMPTKDGKPAPVYANLAFKDAPFSDEVKKLLYETLKEGDVSEPIVDGNNISVFHLVRKIDEKERTFEEAQPNIRRHLESAKRLQNQRILQETLVKRSFVEPADLFK
ncbi:MAG TPA: peptidylprolyl isomerase [Planctomycetota bacterium]|nr:peptidylprolyl isomerase [Planctomycetota bacterium]